MLGNSIEIIFFLSIFSYFLYRYILDIKNIKEMDSYVGGIYGVNRASRKHRLYIGYPFILFVIIACMVEPAIRLIDAFS